VPGNASRGTWISSLACTRTRTLKQSFEVAGKHLRHSGAIVAAGSMRLGFSATSPNAPAGRELPITGLGAATANFPPGQCTYWAWLNRPDIWQYAKDRNVGGTWNGDEWATRAAQAHELEGTMPIAHALVSFQPGVYGALAPTGHVAYVEKVDPKNPHRFEISEMNVPEGNHNVNYRWLVAPVSGMTFIYGPPGSPTPGPTPGPTPSGYTITGAPNGVSVYSGPGATDAVVGHLANGAPVNIVCQTRTSKVGGSYIWDNIGTSQFVPDYYVST
jgi:surface antigen